MVIKMFCVVAKSCAQFPGVYKTWAGPWASPDLVHTPNSLAMDSYRVVYFSSIFVLSSSCYPLTVTRI